MDSDDPEIKLRLRYATGRDADLVRGLHAATDSEVSVQVLPLRSDVSRAELLCSLTEKRGSRHKRRGGFAVHR
jgi:hypothetical protein